MVAYLRYGPLRRPLLRLALALPPRLALPLFEFLYPSEYLAQFK